MRWTKLPLFLICTYAYSVQTPYVIFFYVREYPQPKAPCINDRPGLLQLEPGKICAQIIEKKFEKPNKVGVIASYNGFVSLSDNDGKILFPRTTQQDSFLLLVTRQINPQYDLQNTIKSFYVPETSGYQAYTVQKIFDEDTATYLWQVTPSDIPKSRVVPLHTIIIHAKPENVLVPTGVTITYNQPNLHLPNIFVKPGIDHLDNALFIMNIKQYFAPIRRLYQKQSSQLGYDTLAVTHEAIQQDV